MNNTRWFAALLGCVSLLAPLGVNAQAREEAKLLVATAVLEEQRALRDQFIPERLLQRAYAVAVIPSVTKVALVFGGRRGTGVMTVRDSRGRFSHPIFINLTGGSVGWQVGAQETDIVLVFTTRRGVEGIADGKLTLGAGASVAAGPIGRQGEAATDFNAEIYAYSRARGLFAGIALDGTAITIDRRSNGNFYSRRSPMVTDIINGNLQRDSENVRRFLKAIVAGTGDAGSMAGMSTAAGTAPNAPPAVPSAPANSPPGAPAAGNGTRTFPMEDPAPGQEPPR